MDAWQKRTHSLIFAIGPWTLKRVRFPVTWLTTPFPELPTDVSVPAVTRGDICSGCSAAVIEGHPCDTPVSPISFRSRLIRYCCFADTRFLVDLRGTFDGYLKKFSAAPRHNLLRKVRRFKEFCQGTVDWRQFSTAEEISEFYNIAVTISDKTYQRRLGFGFDSSKEFAARLVAEAATGLVRGYVLYCHGVPITYAFCRIYGSTIRHVDIGYDPEYGKWSPGIVLLFLLIEKLYSERIFSWFDMDSGSWNDYKKLYSTNQVPFVQLWYFPPTAGNVCIVLTHFAVRKIEAAIIRCRALLRRARGQRPAA